MEDDDYTYSYDRNVAINIYNRVYNGYLRRRHLDVNAKLIPKYVPPELIKRRDDHIKVTETLDIKTVELHLEIRRLERFII